MNSLNELKYNIQDFYNIGEGDFILVFQGNIIPICVVDDSQANKLHLLKVLHQLSLVYTSLQKDMQGESLDTVSQIVRFLYANCSHYPKLLFFAVDDDGESNGLCLTCTSNMYDIVRSKEMRDFLASQIADYVEAFYINGIRYTKDEILARSIKRKDNIPLSKRLFHGTCLKYASDILRHGIRSNPQNSVWKVHNDDFVFLTSIFPIAADYAFIYSKSTKSSPVVFEINSDHLNVNNITLDYDVASAYASDNEQSPYKANRFPSAANKFFEGGVASHSKRHGSQFAKLGYHGFIQPSAIVGVAVYEDGHWNNYSKSEFTNKFIMKPTSINEWWKPDNFAHLPDKIKLFHGTDIFALNDIIDEGVISARRGHQHGETTGVNWFSLKLTKHFGRGTYFSIEVPKSDFDNGRFRFMNDGEVISETSELPIAQYNLRIERIGGADMDVIHNAYDIVKSDGGDLFDLVIFLNKTNREFKEMLPSIDYPVVSYLFMQEFGKNALIELGVMENDNHINETKASDVNLSSFKVKDELHPKIWLNNKINSNVRIRLLDIANDFIDELGIRWVKPSDIIFTGSLANYNWSRYSDIDVHIVMDFSKVYSKTDFVEDYFDSKRKLWNDTHKKLKIYGFPVELYVEDINADTKSSGVYSLKSNKWLVEPSDLSDATLNQDYIKDVSAKYMTQIEDLEDDLKNNKQDDSSLKKIGTQAKRLFNKLKDKRQKGLNSKSQEMSSGNIIWKVLRRNGYIEQLSNIIKITYDKMKSIDE